MVVFGRSPRGAFRSTNINAAKGQGGNLTIPGKGGNPVGKSTLVTGFSVRQNEEYAVTECLNGGVYVYAFGHSPKNSSFSVTVTSFIAPPCKGGSGFAADVAAAIKVYAKGRLSESKQIATFSVGKVSLKGLLIGQEISTGNAELGQVNITYDFLALKAQ